MLSGRRRKSKVEREKNSEEPLEVDLTLVFRFGDQPNDAVTVIDNRRVPMVGSIFDSRDTIVRGFVRHMLKAGLSQPNVLAEVLPALRLLRRRR
ncbi:MAG: hypothetical protein K0Q76_1311 [Panacagrimonas sp.]|jgi:hypothetical protein|nr:hypothetical protein [Panacagrimonas sp.]MCC2656203.1 hypothetical protein [Panacagrimonas sp.]